MTTTFPTKVTVFHFSTFKVRRTPKLHYASRGIMKMQDLFKDVEEGFEEAAELE